MTPCSPFTPNLTVNPLIPPPNTIPPAASALPHKPAIPPEVPTLALSQNSPSTDMQNEALALDASNLWFTRLLAAKNICDTTLHDQTILHLLKDACETEQEHYILKERIYDTINAIKDEATQQAAYYYAATLPNGISGDTRRAVINEIKGTDQKIDACVSVGLNPLAHIIGRWEASCILDTLYHVYPSCATHSAQLCTHFQAVCYSIALTPKELDIYSHTKPYRYLAAEHIYDGHKQAEAFYAMAIDPQFPLLYRITAAERLPRGTAKRQEAFRLAALDNRFNKDLRLNFVEELEGAQQEDLWLTLAQDPSMDQESCLCALKNIKDEAKKEEALCAIAIRFSNLTLAKTIKDTHKQQAIFYAIGMQAGGLAETRYDAARLLSDEAKRQEVYYVIAMDPNVSVGHYAYEKAPDWRLCAVFAIQGEDREAKIISIIYKPELSQKFRIKVVNAVITDTEKKERFINDIQNGVMSGRLTKAAQKRS